MFGRISKFRNLPKKRKRWSLGCQQNSRCSRLGYELQENYWQPAGYFFGACERSFWIRKSQRNREYQRYGYSVPSHLFSQQLGLCLEKKSMYLYYHDTDIFPAFMNPTENGLLREIHESTVWSRVLFFRVGLLELYGFQSPTCYKLHFSHFMFFIKDSTERNSFTHRSLRYNPV